MTAKPVVPRERAHLDARDTIDHYMRDAGAPVVLDFIDALQAAYRTIGEHPGIGSPRYAHELDVPGLRHRRLRNFPQIVFYIEQPDHIDVWRVLDARRDIPQQLAPEADE